MQSEERLRFRDAMASLSAAVNVVTTEGDAGRCGITATAVCSVTDTPPSVMVCINANSAMNPVFQWQRQTVCQRAEPRAGDHGPPLCRDDRHGNGGALCSLLLAERTAGAAGAERRSGKPGRRDNQCKPSVPIWSTLWRLRTSSSAARGTARSTSNAVSTR